jgi:hypothetical protein
MTDNMVALIYLGGSVLILFFGGMFHKELEDSQGDLTGVFVYAVLWPFLLVISPFFGVCWFAIWSGGKARAIFNKVKLWN